MVDGLLPIVAGERRVAGQNPRLLRTLPLLRLLLVALPAPLVHTVASVSGTTGFDGFHLLLLELSVIALFRSFLGLPDPSRALLSRNSQHRNPAHLHSHHISSNTDNCAALPPINEKQQARIPPTPTPSVPREHSESILPDDYMSDGAGEDIKDETEDHEYVQACKELVERFFRLAEIERMADPSSDWRLIVNQPPQVQIWKNIYSEHRYRIVGIFDSTLHATFDFLNDILRRPEWDEMVESTRIIATLSQTTRIQHIKVKAIWPTAARDLVLLSHSRALDDDRIIACTMSIDHPNEPAQSGVVRMSADCAGQLVERILVNGQEKSKVVQIVDGDPGGWVPKSILNFVATKALPNSFLKVNRLVSTLPPRTVSLSVPIVKKLKRKQLKHVTTEVTTACAPPHYHAIGDSANAPEEAVQTTRNVISAVNVDENGQKVEIQRSEQTTTTTVLIAPPTHKTIATKWKPTTASIFWILHSAFKVASPFFVAGVFFMMVWNKLKRK